MQTTTTLPPVIRSADAQVLLAGPLGADLLADHARTPGRATFVIHTLAPRALGAPVHTHSNEDAWSFVLEGSIGVQVGHDRGVAAAGDLVCKPRDVPHAFWNAGDVPVRMLEVITPGGFETYFEGLARLFADSPMPDPQALAELAARHGVTADPSSIGRLAEEHRLRIG